MSSLQDDVTLEKRYKALSARATINKLRHQNKKETTIKIKPI